MNTITLPMQVKFHVLQSIKKTALILAVTTYTHKVVTGPKDFTKLPEISLQSIDAYREKWRDTIDNTMVSLKIDKEKMSQCSFINKMKNETISITIPITTQATAIKEDLSSTQKAVYYTHKEGIGSTTPSGEENETFIELPKNRDEKEIGSLQNKHSQDPATPHYE